MDITGQNQIVDCHCQPHQLLLGRSEAVALPYVPYCLCFYQRLKPQVQQNALQLQKIKKIINLKPLSELNSLEEMKEVLEAVAREVKLFEDYSWIP